MGSFSRLIFLFATLLIAANAIAQGPAEIVTDVKVLEIDRRALRSFGLLDSLGPLDLVMNITEAMARSLAEAHGSRTLQSFQLTTKGENSAQFRVASRVQTLDAGVDFKVVSRVSIKREISVQVVSQVRVRREEDGGDASPLFTGQTVTQEIITAEGANVIMGGFVTGEDSGRLARIGPLQNSPLLNYVFSTEDVDEPEIVLIFTPHVARPPSPGMAAVIMPAMPVLSVVPSSTVVPPSKNERPLASPPVARPVAPPVGPLAATPVTTAVAAPRPAPPPNGPTRYTVQVAAFKTEARAREVVNDLSRRYADVALLPVSPGQTFFRVRIGPVTDQKAATEIFWHLTADGYDPLILSSK